MHDLIPLAKDTISKHDIDSLIDWLKTYPRLTQGELVKQFESKFAEWQGRKYCVHVNSGSSANLLLSYYYKLEGHHKVVVPDLSWATTVMPFMQFGYQVFLCKPDMDCLGLDLEHLESIFKKEKPTLLFGVNVLGFPNKFKEIKELCEKYSVTFCEDNCESTGTTYDGIKTGNFGEISTFSGYFGHHFSCIETGLICTDDRYIYNVMKLLREHGFKKTVDEDFAQWLKQEYKVDDFNENFTFYIPAFNCRSTDLQAHIGLNQVKKLDTYCEKRNENYKLYHSLIENNYWKINPSDKSWISNFSYPIIHPKRSEIVSKLKEANVECRCLIAGSISKQPFFTDVYGDKDMGKFSNAIHNFGMYLPNNADITLDEVRYVCEVVNKVIN